MFYTKDEHIRFISKRFSISNTKLNKYLLGEEGPKKQLFANLLISYDVEFVNNIKEDKRLEFINNVNYLDKRKAEDLFGFRKFQFDYWTSSQRTLLIDCLLHTPESYVYFLDSVNKAQLSLKNLFPRLLPKDRCCTKCHLDKSQKVV